MKYERKLMRSSTYIFVLGALAGAAIVYYFF